MGKRFGVFVLVVLLLVVLVSAGCGDKHEGAAKQAIASAQGSIAAAKAVGLDQTAVGPAQDKLDQARTMLVKQPLKAKALAYEAGNLANKIKTDNMASAKAQADAAIAAAEAAIAAAVSGSDLSAAQQSLAKSKELTASAKTIAQLVGQTDSSAYCANLATQQAQAASAARQAQIAQAERNRQIAACQSAMFAYVRAPGHSGSNVGRIWFESFSMNADCTAASGIINYEDIVTHGATQPGEIRAHREGNTWIVDYLGTG